jgi:hypothetical protein
MSGYRGRHDYGRCVIGDTIFSRLEVVCSTAISVKTKVIDLFTLCFLAPAGSLQSQKQSHFSFPDSQTVIYWPIPLQYQYDRRRPSQGASATLNVPSGYLNTT